MYPRETLLEDQLGDSDVVVPLKYNITSYGADYPVDLLVSRLQNYDIAIPSFQRGFVWSFNQASRFIESLLLGLPVPGIFLSKDFDSQQLIVIDGQQRLRTLQFFYEGVFAPTGRQFGLRGVQNQFDGLTYRSLSPQDRRRLDNSIIHATIVQQDNPPDDDSSVYYIFERINTSGTPLSPQEIRSCIYHGPFNDCIKNLNAYKPWRSVYGPVNKRMRDQELVLRFLAFYYASDSYARPMQEFLNKYMGKNRTLQLQKQGTIEHVFHRTIDFVNDVLGNQAFRPTRALNAAAFDSIMCSVARRLEKGPITDHPGFLIGYHALLENEDFLDVILKRTADEMSVTKRMNMAFDAFADIG